MNKYLNIFLGSILILFVFGSACRDDIVLPPQESLEGSYEGIYRVIIGYGGNVPDTSWSRIEMLFSDESYFFNSENDPHAFCDPRGDYVLSANTIELTETIRNCTQIARERDNPRGTFSIRRPDDSVIMLQLLPPDTLKQFLLKSK